jgi:hypothetical protein
MYIIRRKDGYYFKGYKDYVELTPHFVKTLKNAKVFKVLDDGMFYFDRIKKVKPEFSITLIELKQEIILGD